MPRRAPKRYARRHRGLRAWWIGIAALVVVAAVIVAIVRQNSSTGRRLVQGTTVGASLFPEGDTPQGGTGQTIDGVTCSRMEQVAYHIHAHLTLFVAGRQVALPRGIGITPPRQVQQGFVDGGTCFYWLHTHDATGIIHIESPVGKTFVLGDFFDIWGEPLTSSNLAGSDGPVVAYVGGKPWRGDPRAIPLTAHQEITLAVGGKVSHPPVYLFPQGL